MSKRSPLKAMLAFMGFESPSLIVRDETTKALPVIVSVVVFLMAMGLSLTFTLNSSFKAWEDDLSGSLTIQLIADNNAKGIDLENVRDQIQDFENIADVRLLSEEETGFLFEYWLDVETLPADLPLPDIFEAFVKDGQTIDGKALKASLSVPGYDIIVDDHGLFLGHVRGLISSIKWAAWVMVMLVIMAGVFVIALATRTGMALHKNVIEVLHLVGARDFYIARRFAWRAFYGSLAGGVIGLAVAGLVLLSVYLSLETLQESFSPSLAWENWQLFVVLLLPLEIAFLAKVVSLWTVSKSLAKMV